MLDTKGISSFAGSFATNILFVSNYLQHGPDFPLQGAELWIRNPGKVAGTWLATLMQEDTHNDDSVIVQHSKALSSIFSTNTNGLFSACSNGELVLKFWSDSSKIPSTTSGHQRRIKRQIENNHKAMTEALEGWSSLLSVAIDSWANENHDWDVAVAGVTSQHRIWKERVQPGFLIEHDVDCHDKSATLKDWLDTIYDAADGKNYIRNKPSRTDVKVDNYKYPLSCFAPGTLIECLHATPTPIEDLYEGLEITTNARTGETGIVSNERVCTTIQNPVLYGFNGKGTFFTAGHVFVTVEEQLRAVDPSIAIQENPWMQVGRLQAGHVVLKVKETGGYEQVAIDSIEFEVRTDVKEVWGVHLREGCRRYHANGYWVVVNYPKITIKSVAYALQSLPPDQQIACLRALKEFTPLFIRFGISTMHEFLEYELSQNAGLPTAWLHATPQQSFITTTDIRRSFLLCSDDQDVDYCLPVLNIFEGKVLVDGQLCHHRVSSEGHSLFWSRMLTDNFYEHGSVNLINHLRSAIGTLRLSSHSITAWHLKTIRKA